MNQEEIDEILAHAGVKGMKWGKRKSRTTVSKDYSRTKNLKRNKAKSLTDKELKTVINRMQLEKQYKDLKAEPQGLTRANKVVLSVLAVGTTIKTIYKFANSPLGKKIKKDVQTALAKK